MADATQTRAVDAGLLERLTGPLLPFAKEEQIPCHPLEAPAGFGAPFVIGTVPFRQATALRLTVVVKATFSLTPTLSPAPSPAPFTRTDVHHKNQPLAHVTAASDRVPWKTAADITLIGHAHAPGGKGVTEMAARFAMRSGDRVLFDKTVRVVGHRISAGVPPKPFTSMPIVYERAHGGPESPLNPIGRGEGGVPPNVVHLEGANRPAGFGPIAAAWPARHARLGDTPASKLIAPIVELPRDVDWGYFQAAPPDQIVPEIPPYGAILLEGLLPEAPRVEVTLPGAHAVGAVYGRDDADPDAATYLSFHADTLHIDADQRLVTITFRACIDVRDEAQLARLSVAAGVGTRGRAPVVPMRRSAELRAPQPPIQAPQPPPKAPSAPIGTGTLAADTPLWAGAVSTLPFGTPLPARTPLPVPDSPAPNSPAPAPAPAPPAQEAAPPAQEAAAPAQDAAPAPVPKEPPKASPWASSPDPPEPERGAAPAPAKAPPKRPLPRLDVFQKVYGRGGRR